MTVETKRDVFEDALRALEEFGEQGSSWEMAYDDLSARYDAASDDALPDDLPVIPEDVSEYIKRWKDDLLTEPLFTIFLTIQHNINTDNPPDLEAENWIIDHSDTFTRAWVLGVWRVEGTCKIVKLEAEK